MSSIRGNLTALRILAFFCVSCFQKKRTNCVTRNLGSFLMRYVRLYTARRPRDGDIFSRVPVKPFSMACVIRSVPPLFPPSPVGTAPSMWHDSFCSFSVSCSSGSASVSAHLSLTSISMPKRASTAPSLPILHLELSTCITCVRHSSASCCICTPPSPVWSNCGNSARSLERNPKGWMGSCAVFIVLKRSLALSARFCWRSY
mmetsp:Transcript_26990/g.52610  ORF Transcript_26990/g.52610 Transcript_26990/m.52610 type:complete len:202 (-) Transcript_26990:456-1061(-)